MQFVQPEGRQELEYALEVLHRHRVAGDQRQARNHVATLRAERREVVERALQIDAGDRMRAIRVHDLEVVEHFVAVLRHLEQRGTTAVPGRFDGGGNTQRLEPL